MNRFFKIFSSCAIASLAMACSNSADTWTVEGSVAGVENESIMLLEAFNNNGNNWYTLDTLRVKADGKFKSSQPRAAYPDVYRISFNGQSIYFPIDSTETISVEANINNFESDYSLSGSESAATLTNAGKLINDFVAANGVAALDSATILKRQLNELVLSDLSSITAYYIVTKRVNGRPVYNPVLKADRRIIGAVANAYGEFRPNDPRSEYLKSLFLNSRRLFDTTPSASDTISAPIVNLIDIDLPDSKGQSVLLSDVAARNRVVLLNFTDYGAEFSQPINIELHKLYDRYHSQGFEIYQIGLGADEYQWRMAAQNQPWITVFQSINGPATNVVNYNVGSLPAAFVIVDGEIAERVPDTNSLPSLISKHF